MTEYLFCSPTSPSIGVLDSARRFPVHRVYCVGRNYAAHALEMGADPQREPPFFFSKPADAVTQSDRVSWPTRTSDLHHEVELVVGLGRGGAQVAVESALDLVAGYAVGVDLTRRDLQAQAKKLGRHWDTAKGFDESAPISDLVTGLVTHPASGSIELHVNGQPRQRGDLSEMIWSVPEIIAELSTFYELQAGDLIFTGTPSGVAALAPGSIVEASIEGVGRLQFQMGDCEV